MLAAYDYLCELRGEPITDEEYRALLKAQDVLSKAHGGVYKTEIANIKDGNKNESELLVRLVTQHAAAKSMAHVWFRGRVDEFDADEVSSTVWQEINKSTPQDLKTVIEREFKNKKIAALNIAEMVFGWIGGTSLCGEISLATLYFFLLFLEEEGEEVKRCMNKRENNNHGHVEYKSVHVDGWIGGRDIKLAVLKRHAYKLPFSEEESSDFCYRSGTESKKLAENILELFKNLNSSSIIRNYFQSLLEENRREYSKLVSKGFISGTRDFMPAPVLNDRFRKQAREALKPLQEQKTEGANAEALHRVAKRAGLQAEPSTISAIANASQELIANMSGDYAEEFVWYVMSLEKIDASNAPKVINGWLNSPQFKSWEVFDAAPENRTLLLRRLGDALEKMDEDQVQPALEQLREQRAFLLKRYDSSGSFARSIGDMASKALRRLKQQRIP